MTRVTLRPRVTGADGAGRDRLADLHHRAHEACFIANSVTTEVTVQTTFVLSGAAKRRSRRAPCNDRLASALRLRSDERRLCKDKAP